MESSEEYREPENPYRVPQSSLAEPEWVPAEPVEDLKPFQTIWTRPRETVRWLVATNPELHVVLLVCLGGIGSTLDRASMRSAGDQVPVFLIVVLALLLGPLAGLFGLWVSSHLIRLAGGWMGGRGDRQHIKTALAWASVPTVFALVLWIPLAVAGGSEMFTTQTPQMDAEPWRWAVVLGIGVLEMVLGLWSLVLLCNTIAEVQGFRSAWRGLWNLLLAIAVVAVPLLLLVGLAVFLASM